MITTSPINLSKSTFKITKGGLNLEQYLQRINYKGELSPTLETLQKLHYLHTLSFCFENLNSFLRKPVLLDKESLHRKMVVEKRGGYCFEQNELFYQVLQLIGFEVKALAGRVLWNVPAGVTTARAHMLLLVQIEGAPYIADVGFGGMTLTSPLHLLVKEEQPTSHNTFRIVPEDDEYVLQVKIKESWKRMYRFNLQEQSKADLEVSNWFTSTHPRSPFVTGIMIAKITPEARYTLRNNEMNVYYVNGATEKTFITSPTQLKSVLEETFALPVPKGADFDKALHLIMQDLN